MHTQSYLHGRLLSLLAPLGTTQLPRQGPSLPETLVNCRLDLSGTAPNHCTLSALDVCMGAKVDRFAGAWRVHGGRIKGAFAARLPRSAPPVPVPPDFNSLVESSWIEAS